MDPRATAELGASGLQVTRLGLGTGPFGSASRPISDQDAERTVERAYELGLRFFDTAPLYGTGLAEHRLGRALRQFPRDSYVLATKVGRLVRPAGPSEDMGLVFDFSSEGVRASVRESLQRLGLERVDVLHLHDPYDYFDLALGEAYPVLAELRSQGAIRAVGVGMTQAAMEARFLRAEAFDCLLLASRYTLLDQSGLPDLLPLAVARRTSIIAGGVFNTGLLAAPAPGATYDYRPAPPELVERAQGLAAVCRNHGVPLAAAAMQFPLGHPAVTSIVIGARSPGELDEDVAMFESEIPSQLWEELRAEGWIPRDAPVPA